MESNVNLKTNKYLKLLLSIIFVLCIVVIFQAITIGKLKSSGVSKFFLETKLKRDQSTARTLQTLKALMDDEHTPKPSKANIASKYLSIAIAANDEAQIELILKSKGYEDVVAIITNDRLRLVIKYANKLNVKQLNEIKEIVISVAKIKDIEVELK